MLLTLKKTRENCKIVQELKTLDPDVKFNADLDPKH
jgi:hypothetical protein